MTSALATLLERRAARSASRAAAHATSQAPAPQGEQPMTDNSPNTIGTYLTTTLANEFGLHGEDALAVGALAINNGGLSVDAKGNVTGPAGLSAHQYLSAFVSTVAPSRVAPPPAPSAPPPLDLRTQQGATAYARGLTHAQPTTQTAPAARPPAPAPVASQPRAQQTPPARLDPSDATALTDYVRKLTHGGR